MLEQIASYLVHKVLIGLRIQVEALVLVVADEEDYVVHIDLVVVLVVGVVVDFAVVHMRVAVGCLVEAFVVDYMGLEDRMNR